MNSQRDMSDKDPGIKLFGMKILVTSQMGCQISAKSSTMNARPSETEVEIPCAGNSQQRENSTDLEDSKQESEHNVKESESKANPKLVEDDQETSSTDQDKTFKKPDKILHCPRCNSLETKFCYFNNYNVNQPRHFCKNCQRYWTAGGTMRNVPVGAGRRKNKHLPTQFRHIIVTSDGIPTTRFETKDSSGHQLVSTLESEAAFRSSVENGTVLKFGPDAPLNESMESMLNLREHKRSVDGNSIHYHDNREDEPSLCGSSVTKAYTPGNELSEHYKSNSLQCYPVPPWAFRSNPGWNTVASMAPVHQPSLRMCNPSVSMQWCSAPMVAVPTMCPPSMPLQFVPASYWSGTPVWTTAAGTGAIGSNGYLSPSSSTSNNSCCSGNGSPILGKHTRDTVLSDEEKSDMCVFVPKSLRTEETHDA
ncbi:hypothetical protein TanjilG_01542 [Lupinus angustifolius]|uniref:cyclic dof factor 3-like n=1 Tax=Lupinus angustifolius TaxID=3871 RepID=UPI00090D83A9|nr:PREDICTED: cyclic dof factor 3-like [Lupinus angustifolius]OIV90088.1 hypothetical protein TanjilG_01542 [Lupinus angustifolius]